MINRLSNKTHEKKTLFTDFPIKLEVLPSKSTFLTSDHHLSGMQIGGLCNFRVHLNENDTNSSLDVKITSKIKKI